MGLLMLSFLITVVCVFIVFFYVFKWLKISPNPFKNTWYWLSVLIVTPLFYIATIMIWFFVSSSYESKTFDAQAWKLEEETRYLYLDDLKENEKLLGLTRKGLILMLGPPDYENDSIVGYFVGYNPKQFLNMDPDWLEVEFTNGVINTIWIRD